MEPDRDAFYSDFLSPVSPFSEIRESTACLCVVSSSRRNINFSGIQQVLLTLTAWQLRSDVYRFFHIRNIDHALAVNGFLNPPPPLQGGDGLNGKDKP